MNISLEPVVSATHTHTGTASPVSPERRAAFRHLGQLTGRFSEQIFLFTLIWYLLTQTHSAFQVGFFLFCGTVPGVLVSPISGIIAGRFSERYSRLNRLAAMNLFRCILVLIIAGAFFYRFVSIGLLDAAAAILALGGAIYHPIRTSFLPNMLARDRNNPGVLDQLWLSMGALTGVLAVGFFYHSSHIPFLLVISAVFYMIAALLEAWFARLYPEITPAADNPDPIGSAPGCKPLLRHIWRKIFHFNGHREVFFIVGCFLLVQFFFWPVLLIGIPYVFKTLLKLTSLELGLAHGAFWAGAAIGVAVITINPAEEPIRNRLSKLYLLIGILILILALPVHPWTRTGFTPWSATMLNIILAIFLGLTTASVNLRIGSYLNTRIDHPYRDHVWAWFGSVMAVTGSIGLLVGGWLIQLVPVYWIFPGATAGIGLILAFIAGFHKSFSS